MPYYVIAINIVPWHTRISKKLDLTAFYSAINHEPITRQSSIQTGVCTDVVVLIGRVHDHPGSHKDGG